MIDGLVEHLEAHLGPMGSGWSVDPEGRPLPVQLVTFSGGAPEGVTVLTTLGLSDLRLHTGGATPAPLRIELLTMAPDALLDRGVFQAVMVAISEGIVRSGESPLQGDTLGPVPALADVSPMEFLFVAMPVYQPPGTTPFLNDQTAAHIVWLCPIHESERRFIAVRGPEAFMALLDLTDPDLTDLQRPPVVPIG